MTKPIIEEEFLCSVLIGITLAILLLCLLRSKVVQAIIGLWLLRGLIAFYCKIAESFLEGFRRASKGGRQMNRISASFSPEPRCRLDEEYSAFLEEISRLMPRNASRGWRRSPCAKTCTMRFLTKTIGTWETCNT